MLHNLSDAKSPTNRCEGLIAGPAEWHKKKVKDCQRRGLGDSRIALCISILARPGDVLQELL